MKITVFCGGSYIGGLEINALHLIKGFHSRGHRVHVMTSGWNDGEFVRRLDEVGVSHQSLWFGKLTRSIKPQHLLWMLDTVRHYPTSWLAARTHLRATSPDIVLLFNRDTALALGSLLRRQRVVFHVDEIPPFTPWNHRLFARLDAAVGRWVAVSNYVAEALSGLGVDAEKISVYYNGVPLREGVAEVQYSDEGQFEREPVHVGICGQVGAWKGHDDFIDALGFLVARGIPFRGHVFGQGEPDYVCALQASADALGVSDFMQWHGFVRDTEAMYAQLDILVAPSRVNETFGLVAAEAAAHNLPVVVTDRGGLAEVVADGVTGFVVPSESPEKLAHYIQRLVEDAELRDRLGASGRDRVERLFTIEEMVRCHETLFEELIEENPRRTLR